MRANELSTTAIVKEKYAFYSTELNVFEYYPIHSPIQSPQIAIQFNSVTSGKLDLLIQFNYSVDFSENSIQFTE